MPNILEVSTLVRPCYLSHTQPMWRICLPLMLLLAVSLTPAQEIIKTIFDEIENPQERSAFRQVWNTPEPRRQRDLAVRFVEQYPRSVLLREAYELAARASVALGDLAEGLEWAQRSLRLMPENPFLLVMIADIAAKQSHTDLARTSARDALLYLEHADTPAPISPRDWPRVRNELRATAHFVLGRLATRQERYAEAEQSLLSAVRLNPNDMQAIYVLGVVRMALGNDDSAAADFDRVMNARGALSDAARQSLRTLYERKSRGSDLSFDQYTASLKWSPLALPIPTPGASSTDRYAGSAVCRDCHLRVYESWQATGMAKMLRLYRSADIIGDFSGRQTVSGNARAVSMGDRHFIEIREGESTRWNRYPVDYIIGSKWQQAYATRLADSRIVVFPIQYSRRHSTWLNYWKIVDAPGSERTDISRFHQTPDGTVYQRTCAACHTSQLRFQRESATFREPGINCEMCHGPSLEHAERMKGIKGSRGDRSAAEPPFSFKRVAPSQYVAVCAQCHAQSAVHDVQSTGAVNYSEGSRPFYRAYSTHLPSNFSRKAFYRDGRYRATTFISEAFARSQCFRAGGATCGSCHDPHPPNARENPNSLKFGEDSDQMCLQCHTALRDRPERHTRHSAGTEAGRCVSCHMPRIMDALLFPARSHEIDEVPDAAMTERFGNDDSPNACLACHRDRDTTWLGYQLAKW